jgi:hypothetical protein
MSQHIRGLLLFVAVFLVFGCAVPVEENSTTQSVDELEQVASAIDVDIPPPYDPSPPSSNPSPPPDVPSSPYTGGSSGYNPAAVGAGYSPPTMPTYSPPPSDYSGVYQPPTAPSADYRRASVDYSYLPQPTFPQPGTYAPSPQQFTPLPVDPIMPIFVPPPQYNGMPAVPFSLLGSLSSEVRKAIADARRKADKIEAWDREYRFSNSKAGQLAREANMKPVDWVPLCIGACDGLLLMANFAVVGACVWGTPWTFGAITLPCQWVVGAGLGLSGFTAAACHVKCSGGG